MSLQINPLESITNRPRLYVMSGLFATFAAVTLVMGIGTTLDATTSPAAACDADCGGGGGGGKGYGHEHGGGYDGHHENDNGNNGDCGGCGGGEEEGGGEEGGGSTADNSGGGDTGGREEPWWERDHSVAVNANRSRRQTLFGMRKTITRERVVYARPRQRVVYVQPRQRVVYAQPRQRVIYAQPRRARVIRPRIVREVRPNYRTRYATAGGRYPTVVYTAPAVRYAAPAARKVVYSSGYDSGHAGAGVEAYAARGRVGLRTRRAVRTSRGRVVVRSVSAYAQGRNASVRTIRGGGLAVSQASRTRIYGALPRRGYASESYIYADDRGADIVRVGARYRAMMSGGYYR